MTQREEFEAWRNLNWMYIDDSDNAEFIWQACAAIKDKRIAELEARLAAWENRVQSTACQSNISIIFHLLCLFLLCYMIAIFSSHLPDNLQDVGLWIGIALVIFGIVANILYYFNQQSIKRFGNE